ncbi:MAG TPA: isoaspartyl peptidase/L-asparaginase [Saprospiraceae bacterium]|nr:isoaspartyl peptidase/L-asparaginase [Saprospiraceae bacterium]
MKRNILLLFVLSFFFNCKNTEVKEEKTINAQVDVQQKKAAYAIAIHAGAGTIKRENMSSQKENAYKQALNQALDIGEKILKDGGTAMDAVEQTIVFLENTPFFNAGKGAVFNHDGKNEMDASFMDGKTQNAGAVGGVGIVKNPIKAARLVMTNSKHVLLTGKGAEAFAKEQGLEMVDPKYFYTQPRWESLQDALEKEAATGMLGDNPDYKYGTVGCAALDKAGNLAAGTSTGGMTNKRWNRIGDSPIIGAGCYANNNTCAVSATGHGEYFIRYVVAYDISALMEYKGYSFQQAADFVINRKLKSKGGDGGIIGVDKYGNVTMPFNTSGMYRGYAKPGERVVKIYRD